MGKTKEISFNDFLKEDTLKQEMPEEQLIIPKKKDDLPGIPPSVDLSEEENARIWKQVRHFYRTGEKPEKSSKENFLPLQLYSLLKTPELHNSFPYFLSLDGRFGNSSIEELIYQAYEEHFPGNEGKLLEENIPRLLGYLNQELKDGKTHKSFNQPLEKALKKLMDLEVHGEEGEKFIKDIETLKSFLPNDGIILTFSFRTPFEQVKYFLDHKIKGLREEFLKKIKRARSGIKDLLHLEEENQSSGKSHSSGGLDFADSMISFSRWSEVTPPSASEGLNPERKKRLSTALGTLQKAEDILNGKSAYFLISDELYKNKSYQWTELFPSAEINSVHPGHSADSAVEKYQELIGGFTSLIKDLRIAELELADRYDQELHGDHFRFFSRYDLTPEEFAVLPSVILIDKTSNLLNEDLHSFSHLLSANYPVKIISLNTINTSSGYKMNGKGSTGNFSYKQELAAIAVAHRDTFTWQGGNDDPGFLLENLEKGFLEPGPAVFNLLIPSPDQKDINEAFISVAGEIESRKFPRFVYDQEKGRKWGTRFDINANPQPDKNWPLYPIDILNEAGEKIELKTYFTCADQESFLKLKNNEIFIVPAQFGQEGLITMDEYLNLETNDLYGKVPFVWVVGPENDVRKGIIPYSMVLDSRERLDFWNYIQEMGGVNSYHVERAVEEAVKESNEIMEREIEALKLSHEERIEEIRNEAAGEAMEKLSRVLLDLDTMEVKPSSTSSVPSPNVPKEKPENKETVEEKAAAVTEEEEDEVSAEPWVESFRCTSCNDCTEKFPHIFKYNADKQAEIVDLSSAKFEELVQAAEGCPAQCIHPGLPKNPEDPAIKQWIKRAEPFN